MPGSASPVTVRLFGPPAIERDGEPVAVDTRKAVALLAYLALSGRSQSRDHLAALLWPEADQSRARSALRRTLSALNTALGGGGLRVEREALAFTGEGVEVDVVAFRRAAASGDLEAAAGLASGSFLEGFTLRDSLDFEDWQLQTSEDLRRELAAVLEQLSTRAEDVESRLAHARRWVDLDPLHEAAHRELMRLHAEAGDRPAALRQYRSCVAALERELGVEPLEETTALYESIRSATSMPTTTMAAPDEHAEPVVQRKAALPLVGRSDELKAILDRYVSTGSDGWLCVVGGEAGIGKTRLAGEFLARVRDGGGVVVEARCHPDEERLAFGTCVELLRGVPVDRARRAAPTAVAEAARLLPELGATTTSSTDLDSPAARRRLFEGVADVITSGVGPAGGVVFVDDAHWIDESSRDILAFLVRRLRGRPLCVLLTWRTEEVPPAHPLRRMLTDANRSGVALPMTLERLSSGDVEDLARSVGASDDIRATLFDETAGVPFFVAEYLRSDRSAERLPSGVRDLLSSRVSSVGDVASQVLAAAAVLGRAFDPAVVREVSGRTDEEVAGAIDELVAAALLVETDERYDFAHPKLRDYVHDAMTLSRRRILHARAAMSLSRRLRRHPELAALAAHHQERAGDEDGAATSFKLAGDHARAVYANAEALAHYRSALALGHPDDAALHEAIADLLTLSGRYADAIASYEKAAALGGDLTVLGRKLGDVHHRLGDWSSAEAHYVEAEGALGRRKGRARLFAQRSLNAHRAGRQDDAEELARRALQEATKESDPRALAQAHNVGGVLATSRGDARASREHLQASLDLAEDLADPAATAAALNNLSLALRAEGASDIALLQAQRALDVCRTIGDRHREAAVLSNIADLLRDLGRSEEALEHVRRSVEILTDIGEADEPQPEVWKLVEW